VTWIRSMKYERLSQQGDRWASFLNVLQKSVHKISRSVGAVPETTICDVNQRVVQYAGPKYVTEVAEVIRSETTTRKWACIVIISSFVLGGSQFSPVSSDLLHWSSLFLISFLSPKHWVRILPQVNNDHSLARPYTWSNTSILSLHTGGLKQNYFKSTFVQNLVFEYTTLAFIRML